MAVCSDRLQDKFLAILVKAQEERPHKKAFVDNPDGKYPEIEFVLYEREVMWNAIKAFRAESGREPIARERLLQVERSACGHVDYSRKFALYCAELARE